MGFTKHALVTGGCSGIGYNLVKHLHAKDGWKVVVADIRPEAWQAIEKEFDGSRVLYVETDVASWDSQANLFKKAYEWSGGRIDFFAANAGTGDKESIYGPQDLDAEPVKPNLACIEVNEIGVHYGLKLFVYYSRKTKQWMEAKTDQAAFNPKMVITASCAGQYPFPVVPQYNASKHACVGLTRSVGKKLYALENIAVNCIMPGFIATALIPGRLNDMWPKEYITPFSTLNRAYDELISEDGKVDQDGNSNGTAGKVKCGQTVECALDKLYYRTHVDFPDESQKYLIEDTYNPDGLWEQNVRRALEGGSS